MNLIVVKPNCSMGEPFELPTIVIVYQYITFVLAPLNVLANGYSLHIFRHSIWKKSIVSLLLKGLSLFEIIFHINTFLNVLFPQILTSPQSYAAAVSQVYALKIIQCFMLTFQMARNWTVVMLAAYRYEVICRAMSAQKLFYPNRINSILMITAGVSFLVALPRIFEQGLELCGKDPIIRHVPYLQSEIWYEFGYIGVVMFIGQSGIPVLTVCVLSVFVIQAIWKRRQFRHNQNLSDRSPSGDKLVLILCITFFILEIPAFFSKVLSRHLISKQLDLQDLYLGVIANIFIYFDSTINLFVYMASNPIFRKASVVELERIGLKFSSEQENNTVLARGETNQLRTKVISMKQRQSLLTESHENGNDLEEHQV